MAISRPLSRHQVTLEKLYARREDIKLAIRSLERIQRMTERGSALAVAKKLLDQAA